MRCDGPHQLLAVQSNLACPLRDIDLSFVALCARPMTPSDDLRSAAARVARPTHIGASYDASEVSRPRVQAMTSSTAEHSPEIPPIPRQGGLQSRPTSRTACSRGYRRRTAITELHAISSRPADAIHLDPSPQGSLVRTASWRPGPPASRCELPFARRGTLHGASRYVIITHAAPRHSVRDSCTP